MVGLATTLGFPHRRWGPVLWSGVPEGPVMVPKRKAGRKAAAPSRRSRKALPRKAPSRTRFVGRDSSPVLDKYPPKDPALAPKGPPRLSPPTPAPSLLPTFPALAASPPPSEPGSPPGQAPAPTPSGTPPKGLISLERPFDLDEFSQMLGETSIRIEVPREDLAEALRRISDFMGFGIYVYRFRVEPVAEALLKRFVVELERIDFSPERSAWIRFEEKGRSDSPFGPSGGRQ
jgi:hypothetical protein